MLKTIAIVAGARPNFMKAASLVRSGRSVSLSREFPKNPAPNNANPAQHFMRSLDRGAGGDAAAHSLAQA